METNELEKKESTKYSHFKKDTRAKYFDATGCDKWSYRLNLPKKHLKSAVYYVMNQSMT
jgi:hypothetical protein